MTEGRGSTSGQPQWWYDYVRDALIQLSSEEIQRELWLSDGSNGKPIGSFIEAVCRLYDDLYLSELIENKSLEDLISAEFAYAIHELGDSIDHADEYADPRIQIASPGMIEVRKIAAKAVEAFDNFKK